MTQPTTRITIAEIVASLGISRVKTFSCQNMSKSNNLAKESPEFIALEVVESESGKPYFEIEVPRNSWVHVLHWCLEHRTPPTNSSSMRLLPLSGLNSGGH